MKALVLFFIFTSSIVHAQLRLKTGMWRGVLLLNAENKTELPFTFEITFTKKNTPQLTIFNAQEKIVVDECSLSKDSFCFKMPVFDTEFKTRLLGDSAMTGVWINHNKKENNRIAFSAMHGNRKRFDMASSKASRFYDGKWEVSFSPGKTDSSKAVGLFTNVKGTEAVHGTFLTETGDYRYLEGVESNGKLYLSSFDGSHAFLFIAENDGTQITRGDFYSGSTWHEYWVAKRNAGFELRNAESLTYLKNPDEEINFTFYNTKNEKVSLSDPKYRNKAVIVQIMGSWCPNCMDESAYLSKVYKEYNKKGLEIIALAYERTSDAERAKHNLQRLSERFDIHYDILLTGLTGKEKASESLPFLNKVMAFPTTLFLDSNHRVKSIYTGFSGPATGEAYKEYTVKTEKLIRELLSSK